MLADRRRLRLRRQHGMEIIEAETLKKNYTVINDDKGHIDTVQVHFGLRLLDSTASGLRLYLGLNQVSTDINNVVCIYFTQEAP